MRLSALAAATLAVAALATADIAPPAVISPAAPRVLLIGVDGADWDVLDPLIARGKLPTFARLKREGAWGRLRSIEPLLSPLVWTSIATGRRAQDHGILDFVEAASDGSAAPITSARRRVPALWNMASQMGHASGFIGWYATYPAEKVDGFLLSDRMGFHQVKSARAAAGATWPDALQRELLASDGEPVPDLAATRARFASADARPSADGERRLQELAKLHATSEWYRRVTPVLARRYRPELLGVYFEMVDACGHLFMEDAAPRRADVTDADFIAFRDTAERCVEYQDEVLGDILRLAGPNTVTLLVSDHGFKTGDRRPKTSGRADTGQAPLWHQLHGVLLAHGAGVTRGAEVKGATVLDLAPTVLALLGLPQSKELPGKPLASAFAPGALHAAKTIDAYAPLPPRTSVPVAPDDELVKKLAALGYLSGAGRKLTADAEGRTAASHLNEGLARVSSGDEDGALRSFGKASALDPKNVNALVYGARIYTTRKEYPRAKELLDRALAAKSDATSDTSLRLQRATWALATGNLEMARGELAAAARLDDRLPLYRLLSARYLDRIRRPDAALRELLEAEKLTDSDGLLFEILSEKVQVASTLGRADVAAQALERLAEIAPDAELSALEGDVAMAKRDGRTAAASYAKALAKKAGDSSLHRKLGQALTGAGDRAGAEAAFREAVRTAAGDAEKEGAYGDLSLFYQSTGDEIRARSTLEDATRALPRSAALFGMLGAAYGRAKRPEDAIRAYETSVELMPTPLALKTLALLVHTKRKDTERALSLWRQSLALDPHQPEVKALIERYSRPSD